MTLTNVIAQLIADVFPRRSGVFVQARLTTAADLEALPQGSVVRTVLAGPRRIERFFRRKPAGWFYLTNSEGDGWPYTSAEVLAKHSDGAATYIWNGDMR